MPDSCVTWPRTSITVVSFANSTLTSATSCCSAARMLANGFGVIELVCDEDASEGPRWRTLLQAFLPEAHSLGLDDNVSFSTAGRSESLRPPGKAADLIPIPKFPRIRTDACPPVPHGYHPRACRARSRIGDRWCWPETANGGTVQAQFDCRREGTQMRYAEALDSCVCGMISPVSVL